ncbi:MAG: enoyl-CoA hydratase/isomerase family protein [Burkholderia sp.]|jgi:2-(1,2-epoxy-1,2-dihydrophenyl)acetyl-CoA isomerase|uniref:enoyl-CoA hydratase-related protein n=1 Tax=Burkholderia sp. TaxID=36773 RepID=UPI0028378877|nr:enoyl-CoA hydratase-related protein [Burkholderia sp.]MDR0246523.1 enoyl-CoA hydratase/isomerase family protein [Burkholderia sp.]
MEQVLIRKQDGIAVLTLNEPGTLNALSAQMTQALRAAFRDVAQDRSVRAVVLTGTGRAFSAGANLGALQEMGGGSGKTVGQGAAEWMDTSVNPLIREMRACEVPIVCALNGLVSGGSVGLVFAADIVVAACSSYFHLPFMPALGIVPDMSISWFLPKMVGRARAMALALLGERVSAEQAMEWGLIWRCVDDDAVTQEASRIATQLALLPAGAAGEIRAAFDEGERNRLDAQLDYERDRQRELIDRPSFGEGIRAFTERRAPVFAGR